jgi:hypothetical protein
VFYLAFGYFISYLPYALRARVLSSGMAPGVAPGFDRPLGAVVLLPAGCDIVEPSAASLDDQRFTAALIQQAAGKRLAERFL